MDPMEESKASSNLPGQLSRGFQGSWKLSNEVSCFC